MNAFQQLSLVLQLCPIVNLCGLWWIVDIEIKVDFVIPHEPILTFERSFYENFIYA